MFCVLTLLQCLVYEVKMKGCMTQCLARHNPSTFSHVHCLKSNALIKPKENILDTKEKNICKIFMYKRSKSLWQVNITGCMI